MEAINQAIERAIDRGRDILIDAGLLAAPSTSDKILTMWRDQKIPIFIFTATIGLLLLVFLINNGAFESQLELPSVLTSLVKSNPKGPPIPPPTEIVNLRVYPIKSCRGIEVTSTNLLKMGLQLDRNWMFISKSDSKFMTIRGDASMTLIDTKLIPAGTMDAQPEDMLEISIHNTDARVLIPAFPTKNWLEANTSLETVEIWDAKTDGYVYGEDVNRIFCGYFNKEVALVYKGPTHRMNRINGAKEMYGQEVPVNFPDVVSVLVGSEASIKDLNRRLQEKIGPSQENLTIERFRPNIIIRGRDDHPWEEDQYKRIRITTTLPDGKQSTLELDAIARCARCQVPNVNPSTAEKDMKEPWDELMKFRRVDKGDVAKYKPCFGMLCIPRQEGRIEVGAKLEVLETTDNHLYNTRKFAEL